MNTDLYSKTVLLYLSLALKILSARVVLILTLLLTFSLFAWAMALPSWERTAVATIFAVLVFLPAVRVDYSARAGRAEQAVISPKEDDHE